MDGRGHGRQLSASAAQWPTPVATVDSGGNRSTYPGAPFRPSLNALAPLPTPMAWRKGPGGEGKREGGPTLHSASVQWPTPTANEDCATGSWSGNERDKWRPGLRLSAEAWATPRVSRGRYQRDHGKPEAERATLEGQASLWATPSARDWRDGAASPDTMQRNARPLNEQACHASLPDATTRPDGEPSSTQAALTSCPRCARTAKRRLNPRFVEWLMGFPIGWTVCAVSETPASATKPLSPSGC